jgi:hypothetical protein
VMGGRGRQVPSGFHDGARPRPRAQCAHD